MVKLPDGTLGMFLRSCIQKIFNQLNDEQYICLYYYILRGKSIKGLYVPKTIEDKLQWLKLHYHNDLLHTLVDKLAVRDYVLSKIGKQYLNELYFAGDTISAEQYLSLPDKFVIKGTHGSEMNLICTNKNKTPYELVLKKMNVWKQQDYYRSRREWAYKGIPRRIICEKYMIDSNGKIPVDYKIFCFNGTPEFIAVDIDRFTNHKRVFYNCQWEKTKMIDCYSHYQGELNKPANLHEMLSIANKLSEGLPFARVDLYSLNDTKIIFGEITMYPNSGSIYFTDDKYNYQYGQLIRTEHLQGVSSHES